MDFEQIRCTSQAMHAEAAAMIEENNAILDECRQIRGRMASPARRESDLRIRLARYRATLAALERPNEQALIELRIAEIEAEMKHAAAPPTSA